MTADRTEVKYVLASKPGAVFANKVAERLVAHRFNGPGSTILPGGVEFTTTVYFDTPERELFRAAVSRTSHLKLRAREYYSLHPSLTELATDARQLVRYIPVVWLELKYKDGNQTRKRRIAVPKRDVPSFFARGSISGEMLDLVRPSYGEEAAHVLNEVATVCRQYESPLATDCVVNYRRSAWQDETGTLRVTLDRGVRFFAPPSDLWIRDFALVRETLGEAVQSLDGVVIEIKSREAWPAWLREALADFTPEIGLSKFVVASRAVHG